MARKSLSAQLAELREYTAKLEIELAGQREIADRKDIRIAELEAMLRENAARKPSSSFKARVQNRGAAAREYCKHHGVTMVSKQDLDAWMSR